MKNNNETVLQQRQLATFGMTEQQVQDNMFMRYCWSSQRDRRTASMIELDGRDRSKVFIDGKRYNYLYSVISTIYKPIDNDDKLVAKKKGILDFFIFLSMCQRNKIGNIHCQEDTPENRSENKHLFNDNKDIFLKYFSMEFLKRQM